MNIKAAYHYELSDYKKSIVIFYIILLAFYLFIILSTGITSVNHTETYTDSNSNKVTSHLLAGTSSVTHQEFSGMEFITVIFIFIIGYQALRSTFKALIQYSISRKTIFFSQCCTTLTIALIMAFINEILLTVAKVFVTIFPVKTDWTSLYENIYRLGGVGIGNIQFHLTNYFYDIFLFLFVFASGYLVSLIYYRISRPWKIVLNVALITFIIMFRPAMNQITNYRYQKVISDFFDAIFGVSTNQPLNAMITFALSSIIVSYFSWLLIRRATIKE